MEQISCYEKYNSLLRKSAYDKLFFIDKLLDPWNALLDFGCAEGYLTKQIAEAYPDRKVVGCDDDLQMINLANLYNKAENCGYLPHRPELLKIDAILLSSVLHEVYSHNKDSKELYDFWQFVFNKDRQYVIIRDMMYVPNQVWYKPEGFILSAVRNFAATAGIGFELEAFEQRWGSIEDGRNLLHWLLKYMYAGCPNWNRELQENYLSLNIPKLRMMIPQDWEVVYEETYQLSYLGYRWRQDFGLRLPYATHGKMIIKRK